MEDQEKLWYPECGSDSCQNNDVLYISYDLVQSKECCLKVGGKPENNAEQIDYLSKAKTIEMDYCRLDSQQLRHRMVISYLKHKKAVSETLFH
uniref:Uncharacterized protein n=1 Tax=Romanomermis culicivorax TaxID=13658 RepID=A0A915IHA8_ROMCU